MKMLTLFVFNPYLEHPVKNDNLKKAIKAKIFKGEVSLNYVKDMIHFSYDHIKKISKKMDVNQNQLFFALKLIH